MAPTVRNIGGERKAVMVRWGMPSSQKALFDPVAKRADKLREKGSTHLVEPLMARRLQIIPGSLTNTIRAAVRLYLCLRFLVIPARLQSKQQTALSDHCRPAEHHASGPILMAAIGTLISENWSVNGAQVSYTSALKPSRWS